MRSISPEIHRCSADRAVSTSAAANLVSINIDLLHQIIVHFSLNSFVGVAQSFTMAPALTESAEIEEAKKLGKTDPLKAEIIYKEILSKKPGASEAALREYESALMGLGESYRDTRKTNELAELVRSSTSSLSSFTKAKTAKLGIEIQPIQKYS